MSFQNRQKYQRVLQSKVLLTITIFFLIFISKAAWNVFERERYSRENLDGLKEEKETLEKRAEDLSEEIEYLKTDRGKETSIREKFGFAKEGEKVISLINPDEATSTVDSSGYNFWSVVKSWFDIW